MKENSEIFGDAWNGLTGYWGISIGYFFVYLIFTTIVSALSFGIGPIIISGALAVGYAIFNLNISRKTNPKIRNIFDGFNSFLSAFVSLLIIMIVVLLGSCLLIIPGIYWGLGYSMTFFVIADNPKIGGLDAMSKSDQLMNGNRWKLIRFHIRSMFLVILGMIPFGLGLFVVIPWINVATAKFYEDLLENQPNNTEAELIQA